MIKPTIQDSGILRNDIANETCGKDEENSQNKNISETTTHSELDGSSNNKVQKLNNITNDKLDIKQNDMVKYKDDENSEWVQKQLISRAGKVGGKYQYWWNVKEMDLGHIQAEDLGEKYACEKVIEEADERVEDTDDVYVVTIPRYRHHEHECKLAKELRSNEKSTRNVYFIHFKNVKRSCVLY